MSSKMDTEELLCELSKQGVRELTISKNGTMGLYLAKLRDDELNQPVGYSVIGGLTKADFRIKGMDITVE